MSKYIPIVFQLSKEEQVGHRDRATCPVLCVTDCLPRIEKYTDPKRRLPPLLMGMESSSFRNHLSLILSVTLSVSLSLISKGAHTSE